MARAKHAAFQRRQESPPNRECTYIQQLPPTSPTTTRKDECQFSLLCCNNANANAQCQCVHGLQSTYPFLLKSQVARRPRLLIVIASAASTAKHHLRPTVPTLCRFYQHAPRGSRSLARSLLRRVEPSGFEDPRTHSALATDS